MGKILGSWSGMRKYLEEEMLASCLRGRVRYGCTAYVGMDGCRIFEVCVDNKQLKRFSCETVNNFFIENGYRQDADIYGVSEYWNGFWELVDDVPSECRTEYTDEEFCKALAKYRNENIFKSIFSDEPLIRMFAVFDRRLGKRTLGQLKKTIEEQPEWLREFYKIRLEAERIL